MGKVRQLPIPPHFDPGKIGEVWRVPYQELAEKARGWAKQHDIKPAASDKLRICLLLIDLQITFCIPGWELFVQGRSGNAAVEDNERIARFIYTYLDIISLISPTLDTHTAMQIFHEIFLVNDKGEHPAPMTKITVEDVEKGVWKVNPAVAHSLTKGDYMALQGHLLHYVRELKKGKRYDLTIWPYHAMLGGIGHALAPSIEEAFFFHLMARNSQTDFRIKGGNPLTENYSVLSPEVMTTHGGQRIAQKNADFIQKLLDFDMIIAAGQAKSHCFPWTIDDLLVEIKSEDSELAKKVYLLEDCTSPVVVPGVVDCTPDADAAFKRFRDEGMHVVKSTDPIENWPDVKL